MKRKKIICVLIGLFVLSASTFVFAQEKSDTNVTSAASQISGQMEFTGVVKKLSLQEAIKHMQTQGVDAETAELNKKSDEAIATGYKESARKIYDDLNSGEDSYFDSSESSIITQQVSRLTRDFAKENVANNYKAEMNRIEKDTVGLYYDVLRARDGLETTKEHTQIQKTILANVQKKYDMGVASKVDLQSAKNTLISAENEVSSASNALSKAKMAFNIRLGYPLMQNIALTDSLNVLPEPSASLKQAIESALSNRMEIKRAKLDVETKGILLEHMQYTISKTASSYLNAQVAYMNDEQKLKNAPLEIEKEIREKYMEMQEAKDRLETEEANVALAKEKYRLAMISYNAGLKTLTEVQDEALVKFGAENNVTKAIADYDLTVYAYQYAQGVGTERISL